MNAISPEVEESAKRMCEAVNIHVLANNEIGRTSPGFVAINLDDGRSLDGVLYDNRADATRHNRNKTGVAFIMVGRNSMPLNEAIIVLQTNRKAAKNGVMFTEEQVVVPHLTELLDGYIPNTLKGINGNG